MNTRRSFRAIAFAAAFGCTAILGIGTGVASPWTLPQDQFALTLKTFHQSADKEFLSDGHLQQFPLDGQFSATGMTFGGRYGFTDRFEGAFEFDLKQVHYRATPLLLALPEDNDDVGAVTGSIFNFSHATMGAGDVYAHGRYNFVRGPLMVTSQTSLKLPTGYEAPSGTFADGVPDPTTVEDDVALGDGQADLTQRLLLGTYVAATRSFGRLGVGYSRRFGAPGDQLVGDISLGQFVGDKVLVVLGSNVAYTLFEGETIGQSFITRSPEKSAQELTADDVEAVDLSLDRDLVNIEAGVIWQLSTVELRASYSRIVAGKNIAQISAATLTVVYAIDDLTQ